MNTGKCFHDHTKPHWVVEDGVRHVVGGCKCLADVVQGVDSGVSFVVVGNSVGGQRVWNVDGRGVFIIDQGYKEIIRVRKDGRDADRQKGEAVVHLDRERRGG